MQVLVTGGSAFIAGHCILQLLEQGHEVRATIRSLAKEPAVRAVLVDAGMTRGDALTFVAADLLSDADWPEALAGVEAVLHVASPVAPGHVEEEDAVIRPAREGTLRVLRAAHEAGVRRVVLTSAFHAVAWGHPHDDHVFTEADWTVPNGPGSDAYARSKVFAERAAWDYVAAEGAGLELTTILPVAVMGPVLGREVSGANHIVQTMLSGGMPGFPDIWIPIVDVRDVAAAHVLAMTIPEAAGERFLLSAGPAMPLARIGAILKQHLGTAAANVPTRRIPNLVVRIAARFNPQMRSIAPDLGYAKRMSSEKARRVLGCSGARVLGWTARKPEEAIVAAVESMIAKGLVGTR